MVKHVSTQTSVKSNFVRYELSAEDKRGAKKWMSDPNGLFDGLDKLLDTGYKLSLRHDDYSNSPCCWVFPPDTGTSNSGLILSGRGRTAFTAIAECIYKHYVVFDGEWPRPNGGGNVEFWEDIK